MRTDFSKIVYDDPSHTYRLDGKELISATTLIKHVAPEFDKEGVSQRTADREGVSQAEILQRWENSGAVSRDKGTRLHQYVEDTMAGKIDPVLRLVNDRIPEMDAFDVAWKALRGTMDAKVKRQEWTIGDYELGVAGRIDCLLSLQLPGLDHRSLAVFDWKTGKLETENRYENLLPPFRHLSSSKFNQYSIQLNLYRLILERNTNQQYTDGYILHLRSDGTYHLHRARDVRPELAQWLKNGVPEDVAGDPEASRHVAHVTKVLNDVDLNVVKGASRRHRRELGSALDRLKDEL